jgi:hypothetical protein
MTCTRLAGPLYGELVRPPRYAIFQLHIERGTNAWGCLSNVGLVMMESATKLIGFEGKGNSNLWYVYKNLPSPGNKSVMAVLNAVNDAATEQGGVKGLKFSDDFVNACSRK